MAMGLWGTDPRYATDACAVVVHFVRYGNGGEDAGEGKRDGERQGKESCAQWGQLIAVAG